MRIAFNPSTVAALTSPPNNKDITFDLRGQNIFARGVEFKGTDTNTWRPVVDNLTSNSATSSLSANQGRVLAGLINTLSTNISNQYALRDGSNATGRWQGGLSCFDVRDTNYTPHDLNRGLELHFFDNNTNNLKDGGYYNGVFSFRQWSSGSDWSGGKAHQLSFTDNENIWHRTSSGDDSWGAWKKLAYSTDIPSSLKNPHALTISLNGTSQGPYDGSAAKNINITPGSIGAAVSNHSHDYLVVNTADDKSFNSAYHNFQVLYAGGSNGITGKPANVDAFGLFRFRAANGCSGQMLLANGGSLYIRSSEDAKMTNTLAWKTILDSSNYSGILDSRYYTESEVNSLLSKKLDRVNLSVGSWNPRGYNLAADYFYNGGDLSISENGGKMYVSIDGYFWQNEGQYRVLDTSDVAGLKGDLTVHQYLSNTDTTWWPLIWGGSSHANTSDSTGAVYKSHDKLSWQTSSQTLYATHLRTTNLDTQTAIFHPDNDSTLKIYSGRTQDGVSDGHIGLQTSIDNTDGQTHVYPTQYGSRCVLALQPRGGSVYIGNMPNGGNGRKLNVNGDIGLFNTGSIRDLAIGGGIYWNPNVESATDGSDAASITLVKSGVAGGTTLVLSQMNDTNDTIQFKTNIAARLYHNSYPILTTQNTYVSNNKGYINGTEITQVNNADKVDNRHAISTIPNTGIIYKAAIYTSSSLTSYWVRLASIPSIYQDNEFVATIHVQSGHSNPGRSAILLVYLRGAASSLSKSFKICCNSNYNPNRFRLYYKDSDKTSEIWYQTTGQWDGIITTVISQSSEGSLQERLTLYSGSITAVQTPSMSTYLSAQVSTITDNISGNASTATKLATPRKIWGQSFDGTADVDNTLRIRQTTGNYCEGIRIQTGDGKWATIILGATADSGTNANAWSIHRKSDNNFAISRNSSDGANGLVMTPTGMGLGTTAPTQRLDVAGNIRTTGNLYISHATNNNMNHDTSNPRIVFSESGSQAVGLVYTDYDSYRPSKGLKVMDTDNVDTSNVWFEVQGYNYSSGYVKNGSNDNYVLLGGGGHKAESSLRVAYASSAGNAQTLGGFPKNYGQAPFGTIPCIGDDGVMEIGRYIDYHYDNSGKYDFSTRLQASGNNKNVVTLPSASGTLALTSDILNYYWANVKISASSSTTTSPTVSNLTATNSIKMGNILLEYADEINNITNDGSLNLNCRNSGNVSLCAGGGKVGIGTRYPSHELYVMGYTHTKGFGINPYYLSDSGLLPTISPGDGYTYRCLEIGSPTKISCIIADKTYLPGSTRGVLLNFKEGFDGQLVLLKDLQNYGSGNGYFWVMPSGCKIIRADGSSILIGQNQISNTYDDGRSRFFIYSSKYSAWIEFLCANIN